MTFIQDISAGIEAAKAAAEPGTVTVLLAPPAAAQVPPYVPGGGLQGIRFIYGVPVMFIDALPGNANAIVSFTPRHQPTRGEPT